MSSKTWPSKVKLELLDQGGEYLGTTCGTWREQGSAWHWWVGGLKDTGAGNGCAWECGLTGLTVWELNSPYENLKAGGKSLM